MQSDPKKSIKYQIADKVQNWSIAIQTVAAAVMLSDNAPEKSGEKSIWQHVGIYAFAILFISGVAFVITAGIKGSEMKKK